ncbi:uncharacterized protein TM35_000441400 [Trypanosoma theileri]|uniref:Tbingi protein n=1 Tax=Trypanosoma theileri TaxID=67003 RepID=A0A1X0NIA1_9TRYP|nr:uncharacterized protein TM35_000441400 [Trypanosoma theileri]ORC84484.1 hypothetical protein TM35_000441400 [Trypanosoma theileri]
MGHCVPCIHPSLCCVITATLECLPSYLQRYCTATHSLSTVQSLHVPLLCAHPFYRTSSLSLHPSPVVTQSEHGAQGTTENRHLRYTPVVFVGGSVHWSLLPGH